MGKSKRSKKVKYLTKHGTERDHERIKNFTPLGCAETNLSPHDVSQDNLKRYESLKPIPSKQESNSSRKSSVMIEEEFYMDRRISNARKKMRTSKFKLDDGGKMTPTPLTPLEHQLSLNQEN